MYFIGVLVVTIDECDDLSTCESERHISYFTVERTNGRGAEVVVWCVTIYAGTLERKKRLIISQGTRWLTRWDKEVDLLSKLLYYGLTTGRGEFTHSFLCEVSEGPF